MISAQTNMYGQCKISTPETISLRLGGDFSFGTLGFVGIIENLGPPRHVLMTAGHVADDALKDAVDPFKTGHQGERSSYAH